MVDSEFSRILDRFVNLPQPLPVFNEKIQGVRCEDHLTFVVHPDDEAQFIGFWQETEGFKQRGESWQTTVHTLARHIALTQELGGAGCASMIGLSVPTAPDYHQDPLVRALRLYGHDTLTDLSGVCSLIPGKPQHVAYRVNEQMEFEKVCGAVEAQGFEFFTPVLEYRDANGGTLRQRFFGCTVPYGPFAELVQRVPGDADKPFEAFNAEQIDELYRYYDEHCGRLLDTYHEQYIKKIRG